MKRTTGVAVPSAVALAAASGCCAAPARARSKPAVPPNAVGVTGSWKGGLP